MSSLAFILNPLDHTVASHSHVLPTAASPTAPLPLTTPTGRSRSTTVLKRPLPRLAAAIAPAPPALFPNWTATLQQQQLLLHNALALDSRHWAAQPDAITTPPNRKKPRCLPITTGIINGHDDHDDHDGPASPATSSEGEASGSEDSNATKKKTRLCKEPECTSLAVSRRSCVRHGGGSRCTVAGCSNGAKLRNRCFQHGGSTICLAANCQSKAKRYGYCWSHGGGRICDTSGCTKVAAQGGACWAHGGGNRCKLDGCSKRSYQKHGYYCKAHAAHNM